MPQIVNYFAKIFCMRNIPQNTVSRKRELRLKTSKNKTVDTGF